MELLDFMKSNDNWKDLLVDKPYFLSIKNLPPLYILSYQQFLSDLSIPMVQQARGFIVDENLNVVCYAMDKFFNYGEANAAEIDWRSAVVTEKVDGSLMKLAPIGDNEWLLSTNNTIDAFSAPINDFISFGNLFVQIVGGRTAYEKMIAGLDRSRCYWFEMVSPLNRIVCKYEPSIYYLGCRDLTTFEEHFEKIEFPVEFGIKYPKIYPLNSISGCLAAAQELGENKEGFVVRDAFGRRIKVKSPWYLSMHHMYANDNLTISNIVEMWKQDILDDYVAVYPEHYELYIEPVINTINSMAVELEDARKLIMANAFSTEKEYAEFVNSNFSSFVRPYIFMLKKKDIKPIEYIKNMALRTLVQYIRNRMENQ